MIAKVQSLKWDDLRVFLAVYRRQTLLEAADDLAVNPSTVSRRLDALEEALALHLFDRGREGAIPTAAAEELVAVAERMESAAVDVDAVVGRFEREPEGNVVIAVPPGIADHYVAPLLPQLFERYPRLTVELDARIDYVDLARREADLAIRAMRPSTGDLIARKLGDGVSAIVASQRVAASIGRLGDLAAARWITWRRDLSHIPGGAWMARHVSDAAIALRTNSFTAQVEAIRAGVGVCLMPAIFVEWVADLREVPLARALARQVAPMPVDSAWLVGHRANRDVPRIAAVWDFLAERFPV